MKYNFSQIMTNAWSRFRTEGNRLTFATCLKLAWAEAKGDKRYTFDLENARASISSYLVKLGRAIRSGLDDIHAIHKFEILRGALLMSTDCEGVAVMDGKTVGLCKYAVRNA